MTAVSNVTTFFGNTTKELETIAGDITSFATSASFKAIGSQLKTLLTAVEGIAEAVDPEVVGFLAAGNGLLGVIEDLAEAVESAWQAAKADL